MNFLKTKELSSCPNFYTKLPKSLFDHNEFTKLFDTRMKILKDLKLKNTCSDILNDLDDTLSHFITKLIMAGTAKSAKWFINRETSLLKYRLGKRFTNYNFTLQLNSCSNSFQIDPLFFTSKKFDINFSDKNIYELSTYNQNTPKKQKNDYISVHFSRISHLLANRSIKPVNGYVYLDKQSRDILIINQYKMDLEEQMSKLSNMLIKYPDERLDKLRISSLQEDIKILTDSSNFQTHSQYFPPCMKKILYLLNTNKHIANGDRQTLALFLKDSNIPIQETIEIFRKGFNIEQDVFDKKYLYHIRHAYGLEGKKAQYTSHGCVKMGNLRNSENKSMCPCLDDKKFIKNQYKFDIEDIFSEKNAIGRCNKILGRESGQECNLISTPVQYFITLKELNKKKQKK